MIGPLLEFLLELEDEEKDFAVEIDLHITDVSGARKCANDTALTSCSTSPPDETLEAGISAAGSSTIRPWKHAKAGIMS